MVLVFALNTMQSDYNFYDNRRLIIIVLQLLNKIIQTQIQILQYCMYLDEHFQTNFLNSTTC